MKHDIGKNGPIDFLYWLRQRLVNKYQEDFLVISSLDNIINHKKIIDKNINVELVENICKKFWPGFTAENSEFFGSVDKYSEDEKKNIRNLVLQILAEARKDCCKI